MNEDKSFIKLHRKMLKWEWYSDTNTKVLFLHCLLKANWKDSRFEGIEVPRGSFISGRKKLAKELNMSEQEIRTALKHLISTNELTSKATSKFTIITIVNYELYQQNNQVINQQLTNEQPTTNQQLTTIEEIEEYKNNRIKEIIVNCCCYAEEKFGRTFNSVEVEKIGEWIKGKMYSEELVKEAMRLTVVNGKKYLNYTEGILHNWEDKGYKTLDDIRKPEKEQKEPIEVFDTDWLNEE